MFDQLRVCLPVAEEIKISKLATLKVCEVCSLKKEHGSYLLEFGRI